MGPIIRFGLYLLLMLGIGYYSMKRTKNNEDFIIGGRSLGPVTSAISAGASDMSSWLLLGLPGAVFAAGLVNGIWIFLGLTIGAYLNWLIVAPRLRAYSGKLNAVTLPTYLSNRFDDSSGVLKTVSAVVILIFFTLYVASALTEDLPFFNRFDEQQKAWVSRFGVVGFALIAYFIASTSGGTILAMVGYAWGGFGAAFGPLIILSLVWRGTLEE